MLFHPLLHISLVAYPFYVNETQSCGSLNVLSSMPFRGVCLGSFKILVFSIWRQLLLQYEFIILRHTKIVFQCLFFPLFSSLKRLRLLLVVGLSCSGFSGSCLYWSQSRVPSFRSLACCHSAGKSRTLDLQQLIVRSSNGAMKLKRSGLAGRCSGQMFKAWVWVSAQNLQETSQHPFLPFHWQGVYCSMALV